MVQAAVGRMVRRVVDDRRAFIIHADGLPDRDFAMLEAAHEGPCALLCPALARERGADLPVARDHFEASLARYNEKHGIAGLSELRGGEHIVLTAFLRLIGGSKALWIERPGVTLWDELVVPIPSLSGLPGALALLHGAHAALTSGPALTGPGWTKLLAERDQTDPLIAFTFAIHELCHGRDQQAQSAKLNALLADPPEPLLPILQAAGLAPFDTTSSSDDLDAHPLRDSAPPAPGEPARPLFAWIHLSDLDFGGGSAGHEWDRTLVLDEIRKDLSRRGALQIPTPRAIFLTGDIAWSGQPEEYTAARTWLLDLASSVQLGPNNIFAVPGNHDVDLTSDKNKNLARLVRDLRDGDEGIDEALADPDDRALLARRQQHYLSFTADIAPACLHAPVEPQSRLSWSHRLTARQSLRIRLAGLNTSLLAGRDLPKGKLWLGNEALAQAFVEPPLADDELVIVLSHHTLREGWLGDEQGASRWIKAQAHIHLAGHVHEADQEQARRGAGGSLVRIVAGAAHAEAPARGAAPDHGYNLAAVYPADEGGLLLRVWARRWSDKNKEFRTDGDDVVPGQAYAEYPLEAVRYVHAGAESIGPVSRAPATARRP